MSSRSKDRRVFNIMQYGVLWVSLFAMFGLFILMFRSDFQVPQENVTLKIDVKNKINICLPDDPKILKDDSIF